MSSLVSSPIRRGLVAAATAAVLAVGIAGPAAANDYGTPVPDGTNSSCRLLATGRDDFGQLGRGTNTYGGPPTIYPVPDGSTIEFVSPVTTSVIIADGVAYTSGRNDYGQLGNGTPSGDSATPVVFILPAGAVATNVFKSDAGREIIVETADGEYYGAGRNELGQLGAGNTADASTPLKVLLPAGATIAKAELGTPTTVLTTDGRVFRTDGAGGWLDLTPTGEVVVDMSVGRNWQTETANHVLMLTASGQVYGYGPNGNGQLGNGGTTSPLPPLPFILPAGQTAVAITAGSATSYVVTDQNQAYGAGSNGNGQLGNGTYGVNIATPVRFGTLDVTQIVTTSRDTQTFALTPSGEIWGAGWNPTRIFGAWTPPLNPEYYQETPQQLSIPAGVVASSIFIRQTGYDPDMAFFDTAGDLYSIGKNSRSEAGNSGVNVTAFRFPLPAGEVAAEWSAGAEFTMVRTESGRVFGAGLNSYGLFGNTGSGVVEYVFPRGWSATKLWARSALVDHSGSYNYGFVMACSVTATLEVTQTLLSDAPRPDGWTVTVTSTNCDVPTPAQDAPADGGTISFTDLPVYGPDGTPCEFVVEQSSTDGWYAPVVPTDPFRLVDANDEPLTEVLALEITVDSPYVAPTTTSTTTTTAPVGATTTTAAPGAVANELAFTGTDTTTPVLVAATALLTGGAALGWRRRRNVA